MAPNTGMSPTIAYLVFSCRVFAFSFKPAYLPGSSGSGQGYDSIAVQLPASQKGPIAYHILGADMPGILVFMNRVDKVNMG